MHYRFWGLLDSCLAAKVRVHITDNGLLSAVVLLLASRLAALRHPQILARIALERLRDAGFLLLFSYTLNTPLFYGGVIIPPAFNTSLNLLIMGLAQLLLAFRYTGRSTTLFVSVQPSHLAKIR